MMRAVAAKTGVVLRRAGINRAVGFTVLGRGWNAAAGIVTLLLMTRYLSPVLQGYYFTFSSILALSVFFELGLSVVLIQFASHEWADLEWTKSGSPEGSIIARARLSSLLRMSLKWYGIVGGLLIVTVLPLGLLFFGRHSSPGVIWQMPWVWIALVSAFTIALMPIFAVLEGCGLIAEIARLQMWQNMVGSVLLWLALISHWGLFAAPVTNTVVLICQISWLWARKKPFLLDMLRTPLHEAGIDWRHEVWPLQWKIALSCVSGYLIFQMFNPILFATQGAVVAGQMGLSLTLMLTVMGVSISWVTTKSSPFGGLIAKKDFTALDRAFFPCLWQSWALMGVGSVLVWALALVLRLAGLPISHRFLDPLPLALLAASITLNHGIFAQAVYLRAHKEEPFLVLALLTAALVALSNLLLSKPFGAVGMMLGYVTVSAFGLALGSWIFRQKRRQWHGAF